MTTYSELVVADGAQAYWPLDEATSTDGSSVADIVGGYNGSNLIVPGAGGVGAFSDSLHSWQCDGNRAIDIATGGALAHGGSVFSYEAWIKPLEDAYEGGTAPGRSIMVVMGSHLLEQTRLTWNWDNDAGEGYLSLVNRVAGHAIGVAFAATPDLRGGWHYAAATWNGIIPVLYVDAVALTIDASITSDQIAALGNAFTGTQARLGADWAGVTNWSGNLDDIAIYNVPLSACRVQSHYDLALTGSYTPCSKWLRLVRADGSVDVRLQHGIGAGSTRLVHHDD